MPFRNERAICHSKRSLQLEVLKPKPHLGDLREFYWPLQALVSGITKSE